MPNSFTQGRVISGEIAATHPAKLVYAVIKQRKTGILVFDDGVTKAQLFFLEGRLVPYIPGIANNKSFARYLIRSNKATRDEVKMAQRVAKEEKKQYLDILVEKGIVDRFDVEQTARDFYWKNAPAVFAWRHGKFSFKAKSLDDYQEDGEGDRTLSIIFQGVHDHYNQGMVQQRLKKRMTSKMLPNKSALFSLDDFDLGQEERTYADLLVSGTTIFDAMGQVELSHSDALSLAFTLLTLEMIKFKSTGKKKRTVKKKKTAIDVAMEMAEKSVDRIHDQVAQQADDIDLTIAPGGMAASPIDPVDRAKRELEQKLRAVEGEEEPGTGIQDILDAVGLGDDSGSEINLDLGEGEAREETDDFNFNDSFGGNGAGSGESVDFDLGELPDASSDVEEPFDEMGGFDQDPDDFAFNPDESPQDIYKLGLSYEENGAYAVAVKAFNESIDRGYISPEVKSHLGWATYCANAQTGGFDAGAQILQETIKTDPKSHYPYLFLGKIYESENDLNMAELYFVKALELNRDCEDAKNSIKALYEKR